MKDTIIKWFTAFNAFLIHISRGKLGSRLGTQSILILHTSGRRSGVPRSTPVAYFDYQGSYLLVASNWAREKDPDWLLNLRLKPDVRIEVKGRSVAVRAREAQGEEYARLWKFVTGKHAPYSRYEAMISRRIPVVVLEPVAASEAR